MDALIARNMRLNHFTIGGQACQAVAPQKCKISNSQMFLNDQLTFYLFVFTIKLYISI